MYFSQSFHFWENNFEFNPSTSREVIASYNRRKRNHAFAWLTSDGG